jgi:hypothetical protein
MKSKSLRIQGRNKLQSVRASLEGSAFLYRLGAWVHTWVRVYVGVGHVGVGAVQVYIHRARGGARKAPKTEGGPGKEMHCRNRRGRNNVQCSAEPSDAGACR